MQDATAQQQSTGSVLPSLSPFPATHVVAAPQRQTLSCPHCDLVQFMTVSGSCRRCHGALAERPPETAAVNAAVVISAPEAHQTGHKPKPLPLNVALPVVLCWLRLRHGWSQKRLAVEIGVPRTYVSRIENGAASATCVSLERIAAGLGVSLAKVFLMCEELMKTDSGG